MQNDKSPGNDDLTKEFYETFWNKLKEIFVDSVLEAKEKGHLSIPQRQIHKKLETHFFIKCRSKNNIKSSFRETKKVLPDLISSQQCYAYVKNRHINI